jgi:hypothetical protein
VPMVTEVLLAQGQTTLPSTVRPERQWAMLRHRSEACTGIPTSPIGAAVSGLLAVQ